MRKLFIATAMAALLCFSSFVASGPFPYPTGTAGGDFDLDGGKLILDADGDTYFEETSDDVIRFYASGQAYDFGQAGIYRATAGRTSIRFDTAGSFSGANYGFYSDGNTGMLRYDADQLAFAAGGVEAHRIVEANSIVYQIFGSTQQDSVTDSTTDGTTALTKAGDNFATTCQVGDAVLIWGGTTTADYGVYYITVVVSDTELTLNTAPSGSDADVDFYVFRNGTIQTGERTYYLEGTATAGESPDIIGSIHEAGLGDRLTFGLDEATRSMVVCDAGDVDKDYGLTVNADPTFSLYNAAGNKRADIAWNMFYGRSDVVNIMGYYGVRLALFGDMASGSPFTIDSDAAKELTDTDNEQNWLNVLPKINQSATASYNGLKIYITETATGDGTTGTAGQNTLILAGTDSDDDAFIVDTSGNLETPVECKTNKASELSDNSDPHSLVVRELHNIILTNSESAGADEWDFPARAEGWNFIFIIEAAQNVTLDPNGAEQWYLNGTQLAAGEAVVNTAPTVGESITCFSTESAVYCESAYADWTEETP